MGLDYIWQQRLSNSVHRIVLECWNFALCYDWGFESASQNYLNKSDFSDIPYLC